MRSTSQPITRLFSATLAFALLGSACGDDGSSGGADENPTERLEQEDTGSAEVDAEERIDEDPGPSEASEDDELVVGEFEVDGMIYEFGWSSCFVEEIPGSSPSKIINATGTTEFVTMSLSITSTPSALGTTQTVRVTLPTGTYQQSQRLDSSGAVIEDLATPGTTEALLAPTGPIESIEIERDWHTFEGVDALAVPARLELDCLEGSGQEEGAAPSADEPAASNAPTDGNVMEEPTTEVLSGSVRIDVGGDVYEGTEVLCITVPFSEMVIVNASGRGPEGDLVEIYVTNDPDDPSVEFEGGGVDVWLSPDNGDDVSLERTENGVRGSIDVVSGSTYVGETLVVEVECDGI